MLVYSINISGLKIKPNPINTLPAKTFKAVFLVLPVFLRNKVKIKKGINVVPKKISINITVGRFVLNYSSLKGGDSFFTENCPYKIRESR